MRLPQQIEWVDAPREPMRRVATLAALRRGCGSQTAADRLLPTLALLLLVLLAPWRVADAAPAEATLQVMNRELATFREALAGADPEDPGGAGTGALPGHPASRLGTPGAAGTVRPW
jgi:hypothetical protein